MIRKPFGIWSELSFIVILLISCVSSPVPTAKPAPKSGWPDHFEVVEIPSSLDANMQRAYFYKTSSKVQMPLIVSLHTWSGDYAQPDELALISMENDWNYIHPDFRGPNLTKDACLSTKVISDIDDAIDFATISGNVDKRNVFIIGVSGGGYATIGSFMKSRIYIRGFLAWAPITDLVAWYYESISRGNGFDKDILKCTSEGNSFDVNEAQKRSPLYWQTPQTSKSFIEIYAGIHDGYTGSVPISHSLFFFNKLVTDSGNRSEIITEKEIIALLTQNVKRDSVYGKIGDRDVLLRKRSGNVLLTIFDGGYEILPDFVFKRIKNLVE